MDQVQRDAVAEAIRRAEAGTSGEIVVIVDRAASSYRSVPIVAALVLALLLPWPLLWLTMTSAPRIFMIQLVTAAVLMAVLLWYGRGGSFVPGFVKRARAHDVALREFTARGLSLTRGRTGVLLYVALQERYAEVVPDAAFAGRIEPDVWRPVIERLLAEAKADRLGDGLVRAVAEIGVVLGRHAPPAADDVDELPNKVILL